MPLNNLELPASLIADLYKNSLIETTDTVISASEKEADKDDTSIDSDWKYLGNNQKNILIIVDYTETTNLPDPQFDFLTNLLAACKIGIADVVIVNLKNYPDTSYKNFVDHFKSKIIFLYGIEPSTLHLPLNFPHFQVQSFSNCTFLYTPSLEELEKDKVLKSKLWVCLRRIFGI